MADEKEPAKEVLQGRALTPYEDFFLDLGLKGYEASIVRMNESLNRLLTLSTAMAGGSIALLRQDICFGWWRIIAVSMFFLALAVSAFGSIPTKNDNMPTPLSIRDEYVRAARVKSGWIWMATILLVLGLLSATVGVIVVKFLLK